MQRALRAYLKGRNSAFQSKAATLLLLAGLGEKMLFFFATKIQFFATIDFLASFSE
jgi:hypothetical protein